VRLQSPRYWQSRSGLALWLYPVSLIFRLLVWLRRLGYRYRLIRSTSPSVPVVVVGNIVVGGAGKTPLVVALVKMLQQGGWRTGVVSRGYRGSETSAALVNTDSDYKLVGDEALLLARRTGVPVAVCAKRLAAVELLVARHGCDIIVCDDGLQHYALDRQMEICVIDAAVGLGNAWCLPAGPLREPPARLCEVDLIVYSGASHHNTISHQRHAKVMHVDGQSGQQDGADKDLASNIKVKTPQAMYTLEIEAVINLHDPSRSLSLAEFANQHTHAVAAIGRPEKFFSQLRQAGLSITEHPFSDHHDFQPSDLAFNDGLNVLMTEKDSVKCENWARRNYWYVKVVAILDSGIVDAVYKQLGSLKPARRSVASSSWTAQ